MLSQMIEEIVAQLKAASEAYYLEQSPTMSDAEFDALRRKLEKADPDNPFLKEIGSSVQTSPLSKVKHSIPMGSLDNLFNEEEFQSWVRNANLKPSTEVVTQWKMDGLSIELVYRKGKFVQAITRGDGNVGEDVTHTISNAGGFPKTIRHTGELSVRCEAILPFDVWKKYHSEMANPRNASSGLTRRSSAEGSEHLQLVAFDAVGLTWITEDRKIDWLKESGFDTVQTQICTISKVAKAVADMEFKRDSLPFLVDGSVVKVNDIGLQNDLGIKDGRPKHSRAWKFAAQSQQTVLNDVEWQVGSRGVITPVAKVEPVFVGGVTISNVSLHNMDEVARLGVCIGDTVEICRAGDVIPHLVRVVIKGKTRKQVTIDECPECGGPVEIDGPFLYCVNRESCPGVKTKRIKKWIQKREIQFCGDGAIEKLMNAPELHIGWGPWAKTWYSLCSIHKDGKSWSRSSVNVK